MVDSSQTSLSLLEAANIVGFGLQLNLFRHAEVRAWADRHIGSMEAPPLWLLQLATLRTASPYEAAQTVLPFVLRVAPRLVYGVILALVPAKCDLDVGELTRVVQNLYWISRAAGDGDWSFQPLRDIDQIGDSLALLRDPCCPPSLTAESIRRELEEFFAVHSLPVQAQSLDPIRSTLPL